MWIFNPNIWLSGPSAPILALQKTGNYSFKSLFINSSFSFTHVKVGIWDRFLNYSDAFENAIYWQYLPGDSEPRSFNMSQYQLLCWDLSKKKRFIIFCSCWFSLKTSKPIKFKKTQFLKTQPCPHFPKRIPNWINILIWS